MPDISTANQTKINNFMCPIGNEFSIGSRVAYLTTAGALSSATITAPAITSGTLSEVNPNYFKINAANCTIESTALTTAYQISEGGVYTWRASGGKAIRVSTAVDQGTVLWLCNISTAATGTVCFGTAGTIGVGMAAATCGTTAGASGCFCTLTALHSAMVVLASAYHWVVVGATDSFTSVSTVQTASA